MRPSHSRIRTPFTWAALVAATVATGCLDASFEEPEPLTGGSPTPYVALGNSLTAGFQNSGLWEDWQDHSYPAVIARQRGVEDFTLPRVEGGGIGSTPGKGPLTIDVATQSLVAPPLTRPPAELLPAKYQVRPYQNLGVPGALTAELLSAVSKETSLSGANAFFDIVLRGNGTMVQQALAQDPEILTLWIGNNEILGGVTSGKVLVDMPQNGGTVFPVAYYQQAMGGVLKALVDGSDAEIFVANIPPITSIPFCTTVPTVVLNPQTLQPVIVGSAPVRLLFEEDTDEDSVALVLLPAQTALGQGIGVPAALGGSGQPLPANLTLTRGEVAAAQAVVAGYNDFLQSSMAGSDRLHLVDIHSLLVDLTQKKIRNSAGDTLMASFPLLPQGSKKKSAFSLDGVHLNDAGYAAVANAFLKTMNDALGENIPAAEVP